MFNLRNMNNQYSPWGDKKQYMNSGGQQGLQQLMQPAQQAYEQANQNAYFQRPMYQNETYQPQYRNEVNPQYQMPTMPQYQGRTNPYDRLEELRRKRRMRQMFGGYRQQPFSLRGIY